MSISISDCPKRESCILEGGPCRCLEIEAQELAAEAETKEREREQTRIALGIPVTVETARWTWIKLLGWIHSQGYQSGRVPWLDDLVAQIEKKVARI